MFACQLEASISNQLVSRAPTPAKRRSQVGVILRTLGSKGSRVQKGVTSYVSTLLRYPTQTRPLPTPDSRLL